jgi:preprotein translocase subunit YajC
LLKRLEFHPPRITLQELPQEFVSAAMPERVVERKPWTNFNTQITFRSHFGSGVSLPRAHSSTLLFSFMNLIAFSLLAEAAQTPVPKAPDSNINNMVMMVFMFAIVYLVMIRPQSRRQKALQAQIASTKTGDKVITASGIHGIIANVKEKTFILKIAENVKIEIEKSAVSSTIKSSESDSAESKA